jgi:2-dehydropantoate 2-reductase
VTRIAVIGPGGVGGLVAAALARAGQDVQVVARAETAARIAREGIEVRSVVLGDFTAAVPAVERLEEDADVTIVATKATTLADAVERVAADPGLVLPLLNGLDHVAVLRERFGAQAVAAATIRVESDRPAPGVVVQTSPFLWIELGADDPELAARLPAVAELLTAAGVPADVGPSEAQVLWSKLARLNALACTTSAIDRPIGWIRDDPEWRDTLEAAIRETVAVANAEGADIDPAQPFTELVELAHPTLGSSMQRDIAAGREPELDAIPGAVLRAAARHGIACPTIERLVAMIRGRLG